MVNSNIDGTVSYPEIKSVDEPDADFNATMYIAEIHDQNCLIALGKLNKQFGAKNIYYIPIYLVTNSEVIGKIGIFEFEKNSEPIMYDAERDFDIEKFDAPLLFGYVTKEYILDKVKDLSIPEIDEDMSYVDEQKGDEKVGPIVDLSKLKFPFADDDEDLVDIQTEVEAKQEVEGFNEKVATNWMQKFMKNTNYEIENVEDNGDCFFATTREGLVGIPLTATVSELREILVDHFDEKTFTTRKERYDMFNTELAKAKAAKKLADSTYNKEKRKALNLYQQKGKESKSTSISQQEKTKLIAEAKHIQKQWKTDKVALAEIKKKKEEELKLVKENMSEVKLMENVSTIEQFKDLIRTPSYWADIWAIKKLEGLLNIKYVIFSRDKFNEGEVENVLNCGGEFPEHVQKKGVFKPLYYIMVVHTGNHYKLVKYKDRRIFKFNEIPFDVKKLIQDKCMETSDKSEWNYIPKFKNMSAAKKKVTVPETKPEEEVDEGSEEEASEDQSKEETDSKEKSKEVNSKKSKKSKLYVDNVVFQFYSKSSDAAKPGKGSGEMIADERINDFKELALAENKGWRKVLSNFYDAQFQIDGKMWASVEHYFHAMKFKDSHPEHYMKFSLDDESSSFNKDPTLAKKQGRKVKLNEEQRAKWETIKSGVMKRAQLEKYRISDHARKILLLTKDAKLMHYLGRGQGAVEFTETMEIRRDLMNK
jgi:ribA/ribD-fused uncharacterized protein